MYAVVEQGGHQYKVAPGDVIEVEKIEGGVGEKVDFPNVLLVNNDGKLQVGEPKVEGVPVVGEIVAQEKDKKVLVVKKKRRKGYRRINGHRQFFTGVKIISIGDVSVG